jgi:hypothetical protein
VRPVRPVLTAFRQDLALPSGVLGPLDSWALARLAASWDGEMVGVGADPSLRSGLGMGGAEGEETELLAALRAALLAVRSAARRIWRGVML